jgi:hypothetical protein
MLVTDDTKRIRHGRTPSTRRRPRRAGIKIDKIHDQALVAEAEAF